MIVSDFLASQPDDLMNQAEPLMLNGSTCDAYKVRVDGRQMFLKSLRSEYLHDPRYRAIFSKEFQLGYHLSHPHLVSYIDYRDDAERPYILMDYIEGQTLSDILVSRPDYFASANTLERFLSQLLDVLQYLHTQRIVHLDIKPDNLMIAKVSGDLYLLDLGFCYADAFGGDLGRNSYFAAPEQIDNPAEIDARTDLYAVGKLLEYIAQRTHYPLPRHLQRIVARCLQPDMSRRYASAAEARKALDDSSRPLSRTSWITITAVFLLLTISIGLYLFSSRAGRHLSTASAVSATSFRTTFHDNEFCIRILSADSLTCEVTKHPDAPAIYQQIVELPASVSHDGSHYRVIGIGDSAFQFCREVEYFRLPHTIRHIGHAAFDGCTSLQSLTLPEGMTELADEMLINCVSLQTLRLPSTLLTISPHALIGDSSLHELHIPEGVTWIGTNAFVSAGLRHLQLPSSLQGIDEGAFWCCRSLQSITLPAGLTFIGEHVFWHCDSVLEVCALAPQPLHIPALFEDTRIPRRLLVPAQSAEAYRQAEHWRDFAAIEAL